MYPLDLRILSVHPGERTAGEPGESAAEVTCLAIRSGPLYRSVRGDVGIGDAVFIFERFSHGFSVVFGA